MKIWSFTYGCKVNQYETELLRQRLIGDSGQHVQSMEEADLCLINSCTVTAFADKECRQLIRRVLRTNPKVRLIVTGCYATRAPEVIRGISNRIELYTNAEKDNLPSCVGFEVSDKNIGIQQFAGRSRAFIKVQDGCKAPCRYCIIPTVRPVLTSKPVEEVLKETATLLDNGYQEIVLTGIRLGLYRGKAKNGRLANLFALLREMDKLDRLFRMRLSSLEVTEVSDELIELVKKTPRICNHFHIPLQSGCDAVLKEMGRWYTASRYADCIARVKKKIPDCGITADVMVGYPTETEEHFEETYRFIDTMGLTGLHVFRFSAREGTPSAALKPLDPKIVSRRAKRLGELDTLLRQRFYEQFAGTMRETLIEPSHEGWTDNYIRVQTKKRNIRKGLSHIPVWSPSFSAPQNVILKTSKNDQKRGLFGKTRRS